ncbi:GrpB family protein [Cellulomonas sp. NPDC057328]|uniref:GrpB family protein n=1 Tax=Cellulomonas sp. NPDC057328 TaxID=3346101 RepID=UPI00362CBE84
MLRRAEEMHAEAAAVVAAERARLAAAGVSGALVWTGASSLPGALTRGDVDLHLRVPPDDVESAVAAVRALHAVRRPDLWCATLATFAVEAPLPTELAVTPVGSEHDVRFTRTWDLLRADPHLLAEYNAVKRRADGTPAYEDAKSAFFTRLLESAP